MRFRSWEITINGGILVCIAGAFVTWVTQDYQLGAAGWILSMVGYVSFKRIG